MAKKYNIDALKSFFAAKADGSSNGESAGNNYYAFWNMDVGLSTIVRFLPDKNANSEFFLIEKTHHELIVNGEKKKVPCLKQYNEDCPICKESSKFYKIEGKESPNGRQLYKKRQYVGQILIISDPMNPDISWEDNVEVKYITVGTKIYEAIRNAIMQGDIESDPTDFDEGTNFRISKTKVGDWADYSSSTFVRKQTTIDEKYQEAIQGQMVDLSTLLPANPGFEMVNAMLQTHLNPEDDYTPPTKTATTATTTPTFTKSATEGDEETGEVDANKLLEQLKQRRARAGV
jgi:hypothetical protein